MSILKSCLLEVRINHLFFRSQSNWIKFIDCFVAMYWFVHYATKGTYSIFCTRNELMRINKTQRKKKRREERHTHAHRKKCGRLCEHRWYCLDWFLSASAVECVSIFCAREQSSNIWPLTSIISRRTCHSRIICNRMKWLVAAKLVNTYYSYIYILFRIHIHIYFSIYHSPHSPLST